MNALEERVKKLETRQARITQALKSAGGQLAAIPAGASIQDVIDAIKSAAGQLLGILKND